MTTATTTSVSPANGIVSNGKATKRRNGKAAKLRNGNASPDLAEEECDDASTVDKTPAALVQKYRHVAAVHSKSRPSCLSHDSDAAPSFIGFRNLMVIVLGMPHRTRAVFYVLIIPDRSLSGLLYFLIPCHLLVAYLIELAAARHARRPRKRLEPASPGPSEQDKIKFHSTWVLAAWAHGINMTLAFALTTFVVYYYIHHPLVGTLTEMHAVIVSLKTASYAFTNRDLRHAYMHPVRGELIPELYSKCPYPNNITFGNLVYFWWAPTLVYQPVYPRTDKIRWVFVFKRLGEVCCLSAFIWFASFQYAAPVLQNSLDKIASLDLLMILERLLKLSTISLVIWLAGFFALFQSFLNALAEVLRFADRSFYDDWWNSESLGAYWRTWNKPVYTYFKRHVYVPMIGRGWSPWTASCTVFFVSAVLHEVLVGVPTHNIIGVAFLGMFLQLPLIAITAPLEKMKWGHTGRVMGNVIFWVSFTIFGQPFAALMYFYAWQAKYGSVSKQPILTLQT
ncbi:diacylglycerol acyltransferase DGAT2 [Metarhizium album ARSEF 1941]|uniref:diacylglycerol O-acyltransferase n=1 Tax=Metarhizium album (strain ARSEF 1941) TaxID=1081103 RepID=A0A0B2WUC2_METAS|nr:diacylglycerol acyltransferase DGAT2 [Metarhizium album ARSEF 1941]KHN99671.1 diacylglycerol acyltransferase DGAT2 [Metarhizium album ARSEF 1941]